MEQGPCEVSLMEQGNLTGGGDVSAEAHQEEGQEQTMEVLGGCSKDLGV